jgi:hypothetical protein
MQRLVNPWWVLISGGCNCNRDTLTVIKTACPDWTVHHHTFWLPTPMWNISRFEMGIAVKQGGGTPSRS